MAAVLAGRGRLTVSTLGLKQIAQRRLPPSSPLRQIILSEPDSLGVDVFHSHLEILLRLADLEGTEAGRSVRG